MASPKTPLTTTTLTGIVGLATVVALSFSVRDRFPGAIRLEASTADLTPPACSAEVIDHVRHLTEPLPRVCETGHFLALQQIITPDGFVTYLQLSPRGMRDEWRTRRAATIAEYQRETHQLATSLHSRALFMWDDPEGHPLGTCVQNSTDTMPTCTVNPAR